MPTSPLSGVIKHLLAEIGPDKGGVTDGELLARFVRSRDEDALAALVRRHAPMVWGVCRRLLNYHDAEDAFQATFLVLVGKAAGVSEQAVANWLYGVARQTAVRVRAMAVKRGRRESQMTNMPEPSVPEVRDADWQKVAVDDELSRLPDYFRGVIVLCDLEGTTRKEAARQLGIPEGSVASRLARARALLAKRLNQRGVTLSGGTVAVTLSRDVASAGVPASVVSNTIKVASLVAAGRAATGVVSVSVAVLTEGVLKAMLLSKLKSVVGVLMLMAVLAGGGVAVTLGQATPAQEKKPAVDGKLVGDWKVSLEMDSEPPSQWGSTTFARARVTKDGVCELFGTSHSIVAEYRDLALIGTLSAADDKGIMELDLAFKDRSGQPIGPVVYKGIAKQDGSVLLIALGRSRTDSRPKAFDDLTKAARAKPIADNEKPTRPVTLLVLGAERK